MKKEFGNEDRMESVEEVSLFEEGRGVEEVNRMCMVMREKDGEAMVRIMCDVEQLND